MKVRLLNNSIRVRISKTEMKELAEQKYLCTKTSFTDNFLGTYLMVLDQESISIKLQNHRIEIKIPKAKIELMSADDQVGFTENIALENEEPLQFTLEKDFQCLEPRSEDESDLYKNPKASEHFQEN